jgi:NMD protein affecting ribosome stability and mRNA decay
MDPTDRLDAVQLLKEQFQELMERQQKLIKRAVFSGSRNAKVGLRVACWRLCVRTLLRHRHENVENVLVQQIGTFLRLLRPNSAQEVKAHGSRSGAVVKCRALNPFVVSRTPHKCRPEQQLFGSKTFRVGRQIFQQLASASIFPRYDDQRRKARLVGESTAVAT